MNGVEVGRFYVPEIDKVFITYMCDPKEVDVYNNEAEDIPFQCENCDSFDTIIKEEGRTFCTNCGQEY